VISTVAGNGQESFSGDGGPSREAAFARPHVLLTAAGGDLLIGDSFNHRIRRLDARTGRIEPFAGSGEEGLAAPGTAASDAAFRFFGDLVLDPTGTLVISEWGNHRIVRIDPESGVLQPVAGTGEPGAARDGQSASETPIGPPLGLAYVRRGDVYFTEASIPGQGRCGRVVRVDATSGHLQVVAGRLPCTGGD
jgi:sugar lactone lactonase YvrE